MSAHLTGIRLQFLSAGLCGGVAVPSRIDWVRKTQQRREILVVLTVFHYTEVAIYTEKQDGLRSPVTLCSASLLMELAPSRRRPILVEASSPCEGKRRVEKRHNKASIPTSRL
jgi:hypothetical protein